MSRFRDCPVENESPDPCPKCGATVSGKDAVNGVCQAGATWDRATAAERERCALIADAEGAEFQRQIDEHNSELLRTYPSPLPVPDHLQERGTYLHAKRSASQNIGGLIRMPPAAYQSQIEAGAALLAQSLTTGHRQK